MGIVVAQVRAKRGEQYEDLQGGGLANVTDKGAVSAHAGAWLEVHEP